MKSGGDYPSEVQSFETPKVRSSHITDLPNSDSQISQFLKDLRPNGFLNLSAIVPDGPLTAATFDMPSELDAAVRWAADQNAAGKNLYFTVNPVKERINKKPTKNDIARAAYAHVDIDPDVSGGYAEGRRRLLEETVPELQSFDPAPAVIVDSGNGLGVFWRLEDADVETAEDLNRQLIQRFGGDPGTHNIDRLMRLPGTLNCPTRKKKPRRS